jgi:hypothetical protein
MNATLSDLLWANGPKLFIDHEGVARSWAVSDDMLRLLDRYVGPDSRTLETGAGVTTVLFAMKGAQHTCIVPFAQEVETIKAYCASKHIPLGRTEFVVDKSETVLPTAKLQPLDLVLIDGAHGFPVPLIDWYFTADHLKVGGHLILDDTHLWSVNILKQFLQDEPEWRLVQDMRPRNGAPRHASPVRRPEAHGWRGRPPRSSGAQGWRSRPRRRNGAQGWRAVAREASAPVPRAAALTSLA